MTTHILLFIIRLLSATAIAKRVSVPKKLRQTYLIMRFLEVFCLSKKN